MINNMLIKQYLTDSFRYNDFANKLALEKMRELPEKDECIRFFSHLINSMNKWLGRVEKWGEDVSIPTGITLPDTQSDDRSYKSMDWWLPVYELSELESKWDECLSRWLTFVESKTEDELFEEVEFYGFDGGQWAAALKDIALQLNYHSIHHRAQIQYLIRQQGIDPAFVDYIGTKYRKLT